MSKVPAERRPAGIDINMGCSAPHIKSSGRGAALLDNVPLAKEMVAAARESWAGPLSAKIRLSVTKAKRALYFWPNRSRRPASIFSSSREVRHAEIPAQG
jgi:tRNA-dihydrouridine synthase